MKINKVNERLKDFRGLGQDNINIIVEACALDRIKLENEIKKIEQKITAFTLCVLVLVLPACR